MWHMYEYFFKHPFRQDIFKQTYRNVMFRDYLFMIALVEKPKYSVMQSDGNSCCRDVVLDSVNMTSRDENRILDEKYFLKDMFGFFYILPLQTSYALLLFRT